MVVGVVIACWAGICLEESYIKQLCKCDGASAPPHPSAKPTSYTGNLQHLVLVIDLLQNHL